MGGNCLLSQDFTGRMPFLVAKLDDRNDI